MVVKPINPFNSNQVPGNDIDISDLTQYLIEKSEDLWELKVTTTLEESEGYAQNFDDEFHIISAYLMKIDKREVSFSS